MGKKIGCVLIFLLVLFGYKNVFAQDLSGKNVLVIHSYSDTYKWTKDIQNGITSELSKGKYGTWPNIYTTYMDSARLDSESYNDELFNYYKNLSNELRFSVVICSDNYAYDFVINNREKLFQGIPIVFCGVSYYDDSVLKGTYDITGVVSAYDYNKTLDCIKKIQPNVKNVVFVTNSTKVGTQEYNALKKIEGEYSKNFKIKYCLNDDTNQVINLVNSLGKNTAVMLAEGVSEEIGNKLNIEVTGETFFEKINVPIYSFYDFQITHGIIGGYLMSGFDQGKSAANMVSRILSGENAGGIPIEKKSPQKYIFDYKLLKKYKISSFKLPENSVILNEPDTFFSKYWKITIITSCVVCILIILILLLFINIKKRTENEKKLNCSYDELSAIHEELLATHEELLATEEELREQYVELQGKEEEIRINEERYKLAVEGSKDAIWEVDFKKGKLFMSDKFFEMNGFDINGQYNGEYLLNKVVFADDREKCKNDLSNYFTGVTQSYESEFRVMTKWGDIKWILNKGKFLKDDEGVLIKMAGSLTDVSDRKNAEEQIKFMAYYDYLTKLPNRIYFMERLRKKVFKSVIGNEKGAVLFVDLDNFKNVNDTLGHDYGDKILIAVGEKLNSTISGEDVVSRFGGDEFLILLHDMRNKDEIMEIANDIIEIFQKPFEVIDKKLYLTASIGIAIYPEDGVDANIVVKNADTAMYKSKNTGKNKYVFYDKEMHSEIYRKISIEKGLRSAFLKNEFSVYYQPFIDVKTGAVVGSEALSRWKNEELGFVSPAEFIPVAEENRFISSLGAWVFRTACVQNKKWLDKGYKCNVSINVSAAQLEQEDFVDIIAQILKDVNHPAEFIDVEITETAFMQNMDYNIDIMKKLANMGMRIALDDFGTGYSSLNYLKRLPINILKIDKSFIDDISLSSNDKSIVDGIIQLAHKMNLVVIAEGIEHKEQADILKAINCDIIQGYYYSKPVLPELVEKMF